MGYTSRGNAGNDKQRDPTRNRGMHTLYIHGITRKWHTGSEHSWADHDTFSVCHAVFCYCLFLFANKCVYWWEVCAYLGLYDWKRAGHVATSLRLTALQRCTTPFILIILIISSWSKSGTWLNAVLHFKHISAHPPVSGGLCRPVSATIHMCECTSGLLIRCWICESLQVHVRAHAISHQCLSYCVSLC